MVHGRKEGFKQRSLTRWSRVPVGVGGSGLCSAVAVPVAARTSSIELNCDACRDSVQLS